MDLLGIKSLKAEVHSLTIQLQEKVATDVMEEQTMQLKAASNLNISQFTNFNTQIFPYYNTVREEFIYQTIDNIYAVVSMLAKAAAMIPFYGEYADGSDLKPKDKLQSFIDTLTYGEKLQLYTSLYLSGEAFAYKEILDLGVNAGTGNITFLAPQNMVVVVSQDFPVRITGFIYFDSVNGYRKEFDVEEIMFIRNPNPSTDNLLRFRGLSPLKPLKKVNELENSIMDTSVAQIQNGGLPGIVYITSPTAEIGAAGKMKENFTRFLNNSANKGAPYFAGSEIGYHAIGSTLADMSLNELSAINLKKVCNVYNVSARLFNNDGTGSENSDTNARKAMYVNAVIPVVKMLEDGINFQVVPDIDTKGRIAYDTSDIQELQEDMAKKAAAFAALPVMRPNDVLEGMGYKRDKDPSMEELFMKTGYSLVKDVAMPVDILPNTANDYANPNGEPNKTNS